MRDDRLFIRNLDGSASEEELRNIFEPYGKVISVKIIQEKEIAFIEMASYAEAKEAKSKVDKRVFKRRKLKVELAHD